MKRVFVLVLLAGPALADPAPSVLISTVMPVQGSRPEQLVAYGSARPAIDAATTLSQQLDGQVTAIAVTPGETVHAGEHLLDFRPSAASISAYHQAVTSLSAARAARAHTASLLTERLATRDQLASADKTVSDAASALEALRREGGGRDRVTISAPFAGTVETVPVALGARIAPGVPMVTLTARNGLVATVGIEPAARAAVRVDDPVTMTRLAGGPPLAGRIIRVDGVLNPRTRLVDADISIPADTVLSGESLEARITLNEVDGWLVPHDAVMSDDHGAWVFQLAGPRAVRVDVRVALRDGSTDVVTGALDPSRPVVVDGAYQLSDGDSVRTAP